MTWRYGDATARSGHLANKVKRFRAHQQSGLKALAEYVGRVDDVDATTLGETVGIAVVGSENRVTFDELEMMDYLGFTEVLHGTSGRTTQAAAYTVNALNRQRLSYDDRRAEPCRTNQRLKVWPFYRATPDFDFSSVGPGGLFKTRDAVVSVSIGSTAAARHPRQLS